jgi:arsenate reductase
MAEKKKVRVLFVCIGNACRSPMAEAIARQDADELLEVQSAGLSPLGFIPELTVQTLQRNGYSTDGLQSKPIDNEALLKIDLVLNLSGYTKPDALIAARRTEYWSVTDPYFGKEAIYQKVFEDIRLRISDLVARLRTEQLEEEVDS